MRARVQPRARPREGAARARPAHVRERVARGAVRLRRRRLHAPVRADLHEHPQHHRPRRAATSQRRSERVDAAPVRRGPSRLQPRAHRSVHGLLRHRRRRGHRAGDRLGLPRPEGSARAPRRALEHRGHLRPRALPDGAAPGWAHPAAARRRADPQANHRRSERGHVPCRLHRPVHRAGARPHLARGASRLHTGVSLLPGRHDHAAGPREDHRQRREAHGADAGDHGLRRGQPGLALDLRLQPRPAAGGPRRRQGRRDPRQRLPPVASTGQLQRRARRPRRGCSALGSDLRPRGRQPAPARAHQQVDPRRGAPRHGREGLRTGLGPREALLHDRPPDRAGRRHRGHRRPDSQDPAHRQGPQPPLQGEHRRLHVRAEAVHAVSVGRADRRRGDRAQAGHPRRPVRPEPRREVRAAQRARDLPRGPRDPRRSTYGRPDRGGLPKRRAPRRLVGAPRLQGLDGRRRRGRLRREGRPPRARPRRAAALGLHRHPHPQDLVPGGLGARGRAEARRGLSPQEVPPLRCHRRRARALRVHAPGQHRRAEGDEGLRAHSEEGARGRRGRTAGPIPSRPRRRRSIPRPPRGHERLDSCAPPGSSPARLQPGLPRPPPRQLRCRAPER